MKIDVEGLEKDVLEGAVETLKKNNYPRILFESWRPERENQKGFIKKRAHTFWLVSFSQHFD